MYLHRLTLSAILYHPRLYHLPAAEYIESLSHIVRESSTPSKKLFRRIEAAEGAIDTNQAALDDLDRRVSNLEDKIDDLDDSAQSVDYLTTVTTYDLEKRIDSVESDLYYLRSQLNRY